MKKNEELDTIKIVSRRQFTWLISRIVWNVNGYEFPQLNVFIGEEVTIGTLCCHNNILTEYYFYLNASLGLFS